MARTLKDYPEVSLKPENLDGKIDFVRLFGRSGAIHIEIGSGKGTFLVGEARRWGLANVRIIRTDAAVFLAEHVPGESVDCFHIYFPDPWHKKRHNKRRLICPVNLEHFIRCLKTDGQIRIATDHADYFEQVKTVLATRSEQLEEIDFLRPAGAETGEYVGTNFERKYIKDQRPIYTIAVR
ncbi:MAG: tRNA (guanine(46)-N(7))-methyltransferase TrmB, partial [Planctomycetota bacterium]